MSKKGAIFLAERYIQSGEFKTHVLPELLKIIELPLQLNFQMILQIFDATKLQELIDVMVKSSDNSHSRSPQTEFRLQHLRATVDRLVVHPSNDRKYLDDNGVLVHAIRQCPYDIVLQLERLSLNVLQPNRNSDNALLAASDRADNQTFWELQDKKDTTTLISWFSPLGPAGRGFSGTKPHCDFSEAESIDRLKRSTVYSDDEKRHIEEWLHLPSTVPSSSSAGPSAPATARISANSASPALPTAGPTVSSMPGGLPTQRSGRFTA